MPSPPVFPSTHTQLRRHLRWLRGGYRMLLALAMTSLTVSAHAGTTRIAVASNFAAPIKVLVQAFEANSPHRVAVALGSTGKLYAQITYGAPFDALLAADQVTPARLVSDGRAQASSLHTYAQGLLAFWSQQPITDDPITQHGPWAAIRSGKLRHIAIAKPKLAPYGRAAVEALTHTQTWQPAQPFLVFGDSIAQTYQFVAVGAADAGFLAFSQLKAAGKADQATVWLVPQALYAPLKQDMVVLNNGVDNPATVAFMAFLKSPAARARIAELGYLE